VHQSKTARHRYGQAINAALKGILVANAKMLMASGTFWSGVLCMASFTRATSYLERPPEGTFTSGAIEALIPYWAWALILFLSVAAIVLGHLNIKLKSLAMLGHLIAHAAYGTFGLSVVIAAIWFDQSWANAGTLPSQAILHSARAIFIGDEIAKWRGRAKSER
jgi:hypothetical protein